MKIHALKITMEKVNVYELPCKKQPQAVRCHEPGHERFLRAISQA